MDNPTLTDHPKRKPPNWPRLLDRPFAALYLGISTKCFDALAIRPSVVLGCVLWDRDDLDAFASGLKSTGDWIGKLDENQAEARTPRKGTR